MSIREILWIEVDVDWLPVVFNHLFKTSEGSGLMEVSCPFFDCFLLSFDYEEGRIVKVACSRDFYSEVHKKGSPDLKKEIPQFSDFVTVLYQGGFLPPGNWEEVRERLVSRVREEGSLDSVVFRPRPLVLALDTNILFTNFVSTYLLPYGEFRGIPFVLSKGCLEEISKFRDLSFSDDLYWELRKFFPRFFEEVGEWKRRELKGARRAMNAFSEYSFLKREARLVVLGGDVPSNFKELSDTERDGLIISSYRRLRRDEDIEVLFLTSDDKVQIEAVAQDLPVIFVRQPVLPKSLENLDSNHDNFYRFVYHAALEFNVIEVQCGASFARVFGSWKGKTLEDWSERKVKVWVSQEPKELNKVIRVLDKLEKIRTRSNMDELRKREKR